MTQFYFRGRPLRVLPHSSECIDNTNWTLFSYGGGGVTRIGVQTWKDWEVGVMVYKI